MRAFAFAAAAAVVLAAASPAMAGKLPKNGSFEKPVLVDGTFALYNTGQSFDGGWTVVGAPGNVAPISGSFTQGGVTFPAKKGNQWIDLTGTSNSETGVAQTIKTNPGWTYVIQFWIGNVVNPTGIFGTATTTAVLVNGTSLGNFTNNKGNDTVQTWQKFTAQFVATGNKTTIAFINKDPSNDTQNGLDVVSIQGMPPA